MSLHDISPQELKKAQQELETKLKEAGLSDDDAAKFSQGLGSPSSPLGGGGSSGPSGSGSSGGGLPGGSGSRDPSSSFAGGKGSSPSGYGSFEGGAGDIGDDDMDPGAGGGGKGGLAKQMRNRLNRYNKKPKGKKRPKPKSVSIGRDRVGTQADNIFMMVHRRHRDLDQKKVFIR